MECKLSTLWQHRLPHFTVVLPALPPPTFYHVSNQRQTPSTQIRRCSVLQYASSNLAGRGGRETAIDWAINSAWIAPSLPLLGLGAATFYRDFFFSTHNQFAECFSSTADGVSWQLSIVCGTEQQHNRNGLHVGRDRGTVDRPRLSAARLFTVCSEHSFIMKCWG